MKIKVLFPSIHSLFFLLISLSSCSLFSSNQYGNTIPDNFVAVEIVPTVDLASIQKCIVYPYKARKAGIEGKVIVRILLDSTNTVKKTIIEDSDNFILNEAAIEAVKCGKFTPAMNDGKPITCWVNVPVTFKFTEHNED